MRLGDLDALKEVLKENEWITNTEGGGLEDIIDNAPTVNLEERSFIEGFKEGCEHGKKCYERPQGEWIEKRDTNGCLHIYCNQCGAKAQVGFISFCGKCGAKMRGDKND